MGFEKTSADDVICGQPPMQTHAQEQLTYYMFHHRPRRPAARHAVKAKRTDPSTRAQDGMTKRGYRKAATE
jgi:hypothetical protein